MAWIEWWLAINKELLITEHLQSNIKGITEAAVESLHSHNNYHLSNRIFENAECLFLWVSVSPNTVGIFLAYQYQAVISEIPKKNLLNIFVASKLAFNPACRRVCVWWVADIVQFTHTSALNEEWFEDWLLHSDYLGLRYLVWMSGRDVAVVNIFECRKIIKRWTSMVGSGLRAEVLIVVIFQMLLRCNAAMTHLLTSNRRQSCFLFVFQYLMVKEALHERANLLEIAPHLSAPLPIMLPVYS